MGASIIAIDPGQHTGIAFRFENQQWGTLLADKVPEASERLSMVLDLLKEQLQGSYCETVVVIEDFKTQGYLSSFGIETIELIGAVKALCYLLKVKLVRQAPLQRVPFERQARLLLTERAAKTKIPVSDHEISALSHLLRFEYIKGSMAAQAQAAPTSPVPSTEIAQEAVANPRAITFIMRNTPDGR